MSIEDKQRVYNKSTIRDPKIKVSTTNSALKDKIHINLTGDTDKVYWYIRFNMALDPESVNKKTMSVMEPNGYILKTIISYDLMRNLIVLCPADIYMQNEYYLLNVSTRVKSVSGQNLKNEIHIMFKIIGDQITEFQLLKSTVKVPKPRPRTKQYRKELEKRILSSRGYPANESLSGKDSHYKLPYADMEINFLLAIIGMVILIAGILLATIKIIYVGFVVCIAGIVHISVQFFDRYKRSMFIYNIGVSFFNTGKYEPAKKSFIKSLSVYSNNEMSEYALKKTSFYL